ncbi:MAG: HlyD family efflux transporter periplasmic adaptor subunit [Chitinophagaceae bacterium]|nr:HlyD family efflux transporter periplasmic adaptor subunit [Chitinophagaceae bacterium]
MKEVRRIVTELMQGEQMNAFSAVYRVDKESNVRKWLIGILIALLVMLFLPWTQNIRAKGSVTTLRQEQRPQELNSIIPGRIVKWHVKEGDYVTAGDTIVQLAEIKDDYLDPLLLERTKEQVEAKGFSIQSYNDKIAAKQAQIVTMQKALDLKMQQLRLKVVSDSIEAAAAKNNLEIAEEQYRRQRIMRDSGLVSKVQLEQRNQKYQDAVAKKMSTEIKFINTKVELNQVQQEYAEKIYKAKSEIAEAQSSVAEARGELSKLNNTYSNYIIRSGQYFLTAPQDGQVVKASKAGINEIVKDGEKLVVIVPAEIDRAVEIYVRPVDLPLLSVGRNVRFLFDGFPAIVFSGWPQASYGTFAGEVAAIERTVSSNGKFRILVREIPGEKAWPQELTLGAGASAIILLKDVPIWYELWRNINGFPPDYYAEQEELKKKEQGIDKKIKVKY